MARHVLDVLDSKVLTLKWALWLFCALGMSVPAYAMNVMLSPANPQNGFISITGDVNAGGLSISGGSTLGGSLNVSGSSTLASLIVSGGTSIDGSLNVNSLAPISGNSLTVGSSGAGTLVQGGNLSFSDSSGSNSTQVGFATPSGNNSITFPDESGNVCLTSNNCNYQQAGNYQAAGSYVNLQPLTPGSQQSGNINISGALLAGSLNSGDLTVSGSGNFGGVLTVSDLSPTTSSQAITLPNASGVVCISTNNCGYQAMGNYQPAGNYVNLQASSPGSAQSGSINISGSIVAASLESNGDLVATGNANVSGNVTIGGSLVSNSLTPLGTALTVGSSSQDLNLQGASTSLSSSGNGFTSSVLFTSPTANRTITIPDASGTVCLEADPNCQFQPAGQYQTAGSYVNLQATTPFVQQNGSIDISEELDANNINIAAAANIAGNLINASGIYSNFYGVLQNAPNQSLAVNSSNGLGINSVNNFKLTDFGETSNNVTGYTTLSFLGQSQTVQDAVVTIPNLSGTICLDSNNCNFQSEGDYQQAGNYVDLQSSSPGSAQTGNINVSGDIIAAALQSNGDLVASGNATIAGDGSFGGSVSVGSLLPSDSNGLSVGSSSQNLTLQGTSTTLSDSANGLTNSLVFDSPSSADQTLSLPDESGTVCVEDDLNCGFQPAGNYVQLQQGSPTVQSGQAAISELYVGGDQSISQIDGTYFNPDSGFPVLSTNTVDAQGVTASGISNPAGEGMDIESNGGMYVNEVNGGSLNIMSNGVLDMQRYTNTADTTLNFDIPTSYQQINVPNLTGELAVVQTTLPLKAQGGDLDVSNIIANQANLSYLADSGPAYTGSLSIGGGPLINGFLSATASENAQTLSAPGCNSFDIPVPGANMGDTVVTSVDQTLPGTWILNGNVSSANTVTVKACAFDTSTSIPAGTYRVDVWQH